MNTQKALFAALDPITLWFADGLLNIAIDAPIERQQAIRFSRIVRRTPGVKSCRAASTNNKWLVTFSRVDNITAIEQSIRTQAEQFLKFEQNRPGQGSLFSSIPDGHYTKNPESVKVEAPAWFAAIISE